MKTFQTVIIVGGLGFALISASAFAQGAGAAKANNGLANPVLTPPQPLSTQDRIKLEKADKGGRPTDNGLVDKPNRHGGGDYPDDVKKLLDDIKSARNKFLQDQKDLQRKLKDATEAERDQIRNEMRDKRDQFLEQQKDMREEVLKRVTELKDQLKNHQDLIDNAKDQGRNKPGRKGGGD